MSIKDEIAGNKFATFFPPIIYIGAAVIFDIDWKILLAMLIAHFAAACIPGLLKERH